ncbi:MAG: TenA family protein [Pyrodictiaceae archaeon]
MAGLTEMLREKASYIWERILEHPFVIELYTGRLPLEKFKYYVVQDYNYLIGMMRAFSLLASRADYETARLALEIAYADATIEMDNYRRLLGELGLSFEDVVSAEPAPTNVGYMGFLVSTCATSSPLECLVAVLPCFWSYEEIAMRHRDKLSSNPMRIYVEWAKTYLSREYHELVSRLRGAVDRLWDGGDTSKLERLFITASRYEYMFWDMAYRMEKWPI